ncbi:MAG TPA: PQQ-binding-like beta-propeller repeat protein [Acidimicrobiales bacterium]|nr:PQQ-binding-like beta-propeller repeat protein [Acidimicrobiales bacterium]
MILAILVVGAVVSPFAHTATRATTPTPPSGASAAPLPVVDSWDPGQPTLAPTALHSPQFGQIFASQLDGQIYARPLLVGDVVVVATEADQLYGLDADTGQVRWQRSDLGTPEPSATLDCTGQVDPQVGITGTPVVDRTTGTVYFTVRTWDGTNPASAQWALHAVDARTGQELPSWPVIFAGQFTNDPSARFDPTIEQQRPGLLLLGSRVYAAFGAFCDHAPARGVLIGVDVADPHAQVAWTAEAGPRGELASIWQSGGLLTSDGPNQILLATGNGVGPPVGPGGSGPDALGNSVVRVSVVGGDLKATDYFAPANADDLNIGDLDFGSSAPTVLPDSFGSPAAPHLLVVGSKAGFVYLLNRDSLGGRGREADTAIAEAGPFTDGISGHGLYTRFAYWPGDGGYLYAADLFGPLRALRVVHDGAATRLVAVGSSEFFGAYGAGSPLVTSDGENSGSAVVWITAATASGAGELRAYSPVPDGQGHLVEIWHGAIGQQNRFSVPLAGKGRIYVGTADGRLMAFGPHPPAQYITRLFDDLLHRSPTADEIATYEAKLTATDNWQSVVLELLDSPERSQAIVDGEYQRLLHRLPSQAETTSAVTLLGSTTGIDALDVAIASTDEYLHVRAHDDAGQFVAAVATDLLSGPLGLATSATLTRQLGVGATDRASIARLVIADPSHLARKVQDAFKTYLRRDPDPSGLTEYVQELSSGVTSNTIASILLASEEYLSAGPR